MSSRKKSGKLPVLDFRFSKLENVHQDISQESTQIIAHKNLKQWYSYSVKAPHKLIHSLPINIPDTFSTHTALVQASEQYSHKHALHVHNFFVSACLFCCKLSNMIGSSWAVLCNTDVKASEQFCYPMFLAVWKQELNQMMKRLELGHEEEPGIYNVPKNSQDFFACV